MKKILTVDNDKLILEFMHDLLTEKGHEVVQAEDGLSALDVLKTYVPDIIFADLVMPNIDGRKLCKIIRDMKQLSHVHVFILSSVLDEEEIDAEELGITACINKSSFDEMGKSILKVLDQIDAENSGILPYEVIGSSRRRPRSITKELISRKRHLEVILESMSEGILEITSEGRVIYANKAALSLGHFSEATLLGSHLAELFEEEDRQRVRDLLLSMDEGSKMIGEESPIHLNNYLVTLNIIPVTGDQGRTAIAIFNNITERKRAEGMLRSERDKFQGVLNAIGECVFIVNKDFEIEYINDVAARRFGNCVGKKCHNAYMNSNVPCDFCQIDQTVLSGKIHNVEAMQNDGRTYDMVFSPFSDSDGEIKVITLQRDITERKRLQVETMRSAHLASLGELSAGLAHEVNNPINGIINYAEILKDHYEENGTDPEIPVRIIKEADRIAHIVRNLLSFARSHKDEPSKVNVSDIFLEALDLMEKDIAEDGIVLSVDIQNDLPAVNARKEEIQRVFLNILNNARYALNQRFVGPKEGKSLEVKCRSIEIKGIPHIRFSIRDRGTGIDGKILNKICDPFFSTKPKGEGTGLGLSISHGIIKGHGGSLWFDSVEGEYTEAVVDLPIV
jgi:PAS domain S-box-containing protein